MFVYGTLMPGESRWPALEGFAAQWDPAVAAGVLYDAGTGYPPAIFGDGLATIPGVRVEPREDDATSLVVSA